MGHEAVVRLLRQVLRSGRWHHAYLFTGPQGVGKTLAARTFAQGLLCGGGGDAPCGRCPSCRRFAAGTHPDFVAVSPEGQSIGIDQVRWLHRSAAVRPALSRLRVCLLEPAEALTEVAQNALLKTVEEPPGETAMILVSHGEQGVLPTLVSRCQVVRFGFVDQEELERLVLSRRPELKERLPLVVALSDGRPARALGRDWNAVIALRDQLVGLIARWPDPDPLPALRLAAEWESLDEEELENRFELMECWMRDLLAWQESPQTAVEVVINRDRIDEIERQARRWPSWRLLEVREAFAQARRRKRQHVSKRLNLDVLLLQISRPQSGLAGAPRSSPGA